MLVQGRSRYPVGLWFTSSPSAVSLSRYAARVDLMARFAAAAGVSAAAYTPGQPRTQALNYPLLSRSETTGWRSTMASPPRVTA